MPAGTDEDARAHISAIRVAGALRDEVFSPAVSSLARPNAGTPNRIFSKLGAHGLERLSL